jgi:hypothetical protein
MFDEIIFNKYQEGTYTKIDILDSKNETEKVLSLNYSIDISFKNINSYKYNLKENE